MIGILLGEPTWDNLPKLIEMYQASGGFSRGVPGVPDTRSLSKQIIFNLELFMRIKYVEPYNYKLSTVPLVEALQLVNENLDVSKQIMIDFLIKSNCSDALLKKLKATNDLGIIFNYVIHQNIVNENVL